MQFQAICSKWNRKLTLSLTASNIEEARSILHGQGYSIMELREFNETDIESKWNFFYFDIRMNGQIKTGKIQSEDIFKSYKKLIDDLEYDVVYIYTNEGMPEEQKKIITAKVRDSYRLYKQSLWENIDEKKMEKTDEERDVSQVSVQMLREIEKYTLISESTIEKIQNLFLKYHNTISPEQKNALEKLEQSLLQVKWASNLAKIKMIVEEALKKVGETEIALVKNGASQEKQKYLEETNALLKQIGSSERFDTGARWANADIWQLINRLFTPKKKEEKVLEQKKTETQKKVDSNSFIYYKNQRELALYKENLKKTEIQILKTIFTFQFSYLKRLLLKKRLLVQNITIIDNRLNNKNISYTKVVKGFSYYTDLILSGVQEISYIFTYALFFYIVWFEIIQIAEYFWILQYTLQTKPYLYITIGSVIALIFSFVRSFLTFIISIPLILFIITILSYNF